MKFTFIIFISFLLGCGNNSKEVEYCKLLNEAISSKYIQKEFFLCEDKTEFILYDKQKRFKNCAQLNVCGKEIKISHDRKYNELNSNDNYSTKDNSIIILHKIIKIDSTYKLYFWRPYSGAVVNLTYRISNHEIKLTNCVIGTL